MFILLELKKDNSYKKVCKNNKYSEILMPNEENEILIYWHDLKLLKVQFVIYVDFETIFEKVNV